MTDPLEQRLSHTENRMTFLESVYRAMDNEIAVINQKISAQTTMIQALNANVSDLQQKMNTVIITLDSHTNTFEEHGAMLRHIITKLERDTGTT